MKKAISPVVAIALLLVVAVVAVVGFQNWFGSFSSEVFADVEQQSSGSVNSDNVEAIIGDELYFKNGKSSNLTIQEIKIGDKVCNLSEFNISSGMNNFSLANCTQNIDSGYYDVVVVTNQEVISRKMRVEGVEPVSCLLSGITRQEGQKYEFFNSLTVPYGNSCSSLNRTCLNNGSFDGDSSYNYSSCAQLPINCSALSLTGGEWITIPGNSLYSTSDFCVMKYETKNDGSNNAISQATGSPWVSLTWQQAKTNCEALGTGYHLITDNEWLTIAKNAENVASNWNSSVVGTGFMYLGHNDNNPASSLAADTNDSNGYYGTNDGVSSPGDGSFSNFPSNDARAYQGQRRTLTLSNGEVIWDLAGNVGEWVNDSMPVASRYHGGNAGWMSYSSDDGTGKIASSVPALKIPSNGWNANQGMGRYYDGYSLAGAYNNLNEAPDLCTGYCSPNVVFLRGSFWNTGVEAGAFALYLNLGVSDSGTLFGYRCAYAP